MSAIHSIQPLGVFSPFEIDKRMYQAFFSKERRISFVFQHYRMVAGSIIEAVKIKAKQASSLSPKNAVIISRSWLADLVNQSSASRLISSRIELYLESVLESDTSLCIKLKEQTECSEVARKIAHRFFSQDVVFPKVTLALDIGLWSEEKSRAAIDFLQEAVGYKQSKKPLHFSKADIAKFGLKKHLVTQDPQEMSCFAYALFYAGEIEARHSIFKKECAFDLLNLFDLLTAWDYFSILNPEAGDLVVYVGDDKSPKHMGVFIEEDLVLSKPGDRAKFAYTHQLFSVAFEYGNRVIFFRKGPGLS